MKKKYFSPQLNVLKYPELDKTICLSENSSTVDNLPIGGDDDDESGGWTPPFPIG